MAKRNRDYHAEELRRNALAQSLGFKNRYEMRKAREAKTFPSAKEIRENKEVRREVKALKQRVAYFKEREKEQQNFFEYASGERTRKNAGRRDAESRKWSYQHSRQGATKFRDSWPAARKDLYFRAFVKQWTVANDERDFEPVYEYMIEFGDHEPSEYDKNPYKSN